MRKDSGLLGGLVYGLPQTVISSGNAVASHLVVVPAQMVYLQIPAPELRAFADSLFPALAKNEIADSVKGSGHRYKAGHDLLVDVPQTLFDQGPPEALRQAGHILLTDFPTRQGIPIPGFSELGLGHLVEGVGISSGWMQLNLFDAVAGLLIISDGTSNLVQALKGTLDMDFGTAVTTFGAGAVDLVLAAATQNPLALAGGIQNVLAGVVSTWETYTVYVDPLDFFGATGMSALLGYGIAIGIGKQSLSDATKQALRSGTIGALFSVSTAFGFGALGGFAASQLASSLARHHNTQARMKLSVDEHAYQMLVHEVCNGNAAVAQLMERALPVEILNCEPPGLNLDGVTLDTSAPGLALDGVSLDTTSITLSTEATVLCTTSQTLRTDPPGLATLYRSAVARGLA